MYCFLTMAVGIYYTIIATCLIAHVRGECADSTTYSGTLNVTVGGYTCQRWDSQQPHDHNRNTSNYFPNDGSVYDAHNYCRDAGGTYELWCYTTDETERWDYCVSPDEICQVQDADRKICLDLPRHMNSTNCPNDTLFYLCSHGFEEGYYMISVLYDLECFKYMCCLNVSATTSEGQTVSTLPYTSPIPGQTISSEFSGQTSTSSVEDKRLNDSMSVTQTTTPHSSCKRWTTNINIYLLIFILSMVIFN